MERAEEEERNLALEIKTLEAQLARIIESLEEELAEEERPPGKSRSMIPPQYVGDVHVQLGF